MDRRDAILKAALDSFAATGETAIEDVKQRSGASVGSIYHHFGGKDGIAVALYIEILREYQSGALNALDDTNGAEEGVKALVHHHLRWVASNPERARFLLRGSDARAAASEELQELNRNLSTAIDDWIERSGAIRPLPREAFYVVVIGPAQEASRLWLAGRIGSLKKLEDELAEAAWRAVRVE